MKSLFFTILVLTTILVVVNSRYHSHSKRTSHRNVHDKQEYLRQLKRMSHQEFGCHKSHHQGCNIFAGDCVCDTVRACHSPYVYDTERECRKDIHNVADHCLNVPCEHGVCVQVKRYGHRTWECECTSSGFYGHRCQHACPEQSQPLPENYPAECIIIED